MSNPGHLQDPPASIKPTGNVATKTATTKTVTTNAKSSHRHKPEKLARTRNRYNLAAYLLRDDTTEMRALGMISADDEWSRIDVVGWYLEAWEQSWEQMGMEAADAPAGAPADTPADAEGEGEGEGYEEIEKEKDAQQKYGK